jgi:excisionase family DNA binding protein
MRRQHDPERANGAMKKDNGAVAATSDGTAPAGMLTLREAAQSVGVSRSTVNGWLNSGHLTAEMHGRLRYIRPDELVAAQATAHVGSVVPAWRQNPRRAGKRLRSLREAAGLSQIQLGAASGLSHEAISNIERGRPSPSAESVRKLARALKVSPEIFVGHESVGLSVLSVGEAAARLDVPAGRVQTWLRQGLLAGTKVSGQWRVPTVVVRELGRSGRLRGNSRRLDPRYRG